MSKYDLTIYQKEDGVVVAAHTDLSKGERDSLISQIESHHSYREEAVEGMNYKWNGSSFEKLPDEVQSAWNFIREKRIRALQLSDWTQAADSPLSDSKKAEWVTYRQTLRDLPSQYSESDTWEAVVWPTKPS